MVDGINLAASRQEKVFTAYGNASTLVPAVVPLLMHPTLDRKPRPVVRPRVVRGMTRILRFKPAFRVKFEA